MAEKINLIEALDNFQFDQKENLPVKEKHLPIGFKHRVFKDVMGKIGVQEKPKKLLKKLFLVAAPVAIIFIIAGACIMNNVTNSTGHNNIASSNPWSAPTPILGLSPKNHSDLSLLNEDITIVPGNPKSDITTGFYNYNAKLIYKFRADKDVNELFYLPCLTVDGTVISAKPKIIANGTNVNFSTIYASNIKYDDLSKHFFTIPHSDQWPSIVCLDNKKTKKAFCFVGKTVDNYDKFVSAYTSQFVTTSYNLSDNVNVYKINPTSNQTVSYSFPSSMSKSAFYFSSNNTAFRAYNGTNENNTISGTLELSNGVDYYIAVPKDGVNNDIISIQLGGKELKCETMTIKSLITKFAGNNCDIDYAYKTLIAQLNAVINGGTGPVIPVSMPDVISPSSYCNFCPYYSMNNFTLQLNKEEVTTIEIDYSLKSDSNGAKVLQGIQLLDSSSSDWTFVGSRTLSVTPGQNLKLYANSLNGASFTQTDGTQGKNYNTAIPDGILKMEFVTGN